MDTKPREELKFTNYADGVAIVSATFYLRAAPSRLGHRNRYPSRPSECTLLGVVLSLIRCPGCESTTTVTNSACYGCGRCLNCGRLRIEPIADCSKCSSILCKCCGRCLDCHDSPTIRLPICECGHPENKQQLEGLLKQFSVKNK